MKLIVGLGNPGKKFINTRHNAGFRAIEVFAQAINKNEFIFKHQSLIVKTANFILVKPETSMNLSGQAVMEIAKYYKISPENILIIYDDITLDVGMVRTREQGSAGGQKGMANIINLFKTNKIKRVRIGVSNHSQFNLEDWVLSPFNQTEKTILISVFTITTKIIKFFLDDKLKKAMDEFN